MTNRTSRRTWGSPGDRDWLELDSPQQRLYPDVSALDPTFSSVSSKGYTVDFSKEEDEYVNDDEGAYVVEEHVTRRSRSCLVVSQNRSRTNSECSTSTTTSEIRMKRKSHSEKFQETHDSVACFFDNLTNCVGDFSNLFAIVALIIVVVGLLYLMVSPASPPGKVLPRSLLADINAVTMNEFGGDRRVKTILKYVFEVLLHNDVKAPVVVLLAGHENITGQLLHSLQQLLADHHHRLPLDIKIPANGSSTRRHLEGELFKYLNADDNRIVFMHSIDRLPGNTPLLLHAICDPDTAPYKQLLLIGTLSPPTIPFSAASKSSDRVRSVQKGECDEHVTNYLLDAWNSLKPDKTYPIISRISAILLCLI